jgi:hypothetical protein
LNSSLLTIGGVAYMIFMWVVVTSPILFALSLLASAAYRLGPRRRTPLGIPTIAWPAIGGLATVIVVLGGLFGTTRVQQPASLPPAELGVLILVVFQLAVAVWALVSSRRRVAAALALLPALWLALLAAFVSAWAIDAGGTLGAL